MRGARRTADDDDSTNPFADDDSPKPAASRKKSSSSYNPFAAPATSGRDSAAASNPFAAPSSFSSSSTSASSRSDYNPFASTPTPPEKASHARAPSSSASASSSASSSNANDGSSAMASYYAQLAAAPPTLAPPPAAASVTRKPSVSASSAPSISSTSSASTSHTAAATAAPSSSSSPVFKLEALDGWKPSKEQGRIVHMAAGNDVLAIVTSSNWLIRWSVEREEIEPILLSKRVDDAVHKVFLDPFGHHCLIAMAHGSTYYLHSKWSKAHTLSKLKGLVVDSVAWHTADGEASSLSSSGRILLGTSTGLIYEAVLDSVDKDKNVRKLYDLNAGDAGDGGVGPVCGLAMELFPSTTDSAEDKWVIIAATPRRQYEFIGGPTASAIFERYQTNPAAGFLELPGTLNYTELRVNAKYGKDGAEGKDSEPAKAAAWLTGAGIYYSQVRFGQQSEVGEHVLEDGKLLSYPEDEHGVRTPPLSCALTEFHLVLLNNNRLAAINQLSEEVVWEQAYKNHTDLIGFAYDPCKSVIWMYSSRGVYELVIEGEDSEMWKLFLQQGKFDEALHYADSEEDKQTVKLAQADELFASKLYQQAAKLYAETNKQFEEIALKFVQISGDGLPGQKPSADDVTGGGGAMDGMNGTAGVRAAHSSTSSLDARAALKIYLLQKFDRLPATHRTQQTMICTWLTEIFLDNINRLHDAPPTPALTAAEEQRRQAMNGKRVADGGDGADQDAGSFSPFRSIDDADEHHSNGLTAQTGGAASSSAASALLDDDPYATLSADERNDLCEAEVEQFRTFLANCSNCLDPATTIALLSSHGRMKEWLQYASNDLEWVLTQHVQEQQWKDALQLLRHRADPSNQADLFYKFVPAIITHLPADTVDMLCEKKQLDPAKLIPALMRYEELPQSHPAAPTAAVNQALRYLEHAVYRFRSRDPVVHNYLLSLYASEADSKPFLRYLDSCRVGGPVFDTQYALRVCYEHNQPEACVAIYALMGLYEEAVTLALQADIPLAKRVIQQAESVTGSSAPDPHTIKRLWLLIAKTIIASHSNDLHKAMELLKDCGSLQLEDMLPFFPDFVRIGELKDEINRSLTSYNQAIDALQADMNKSTQQAQDIRNQLLQLKQRNIHINTNRKCDRCALPAVSQPFLLFPCTHTLHVECAKQEWRAYWDKHPQSRKHAIADRSQREKDKVRERQQQRSRLQAAGQAVSQPPPSNGQLEWSAMSKAQKEDAVLQELIASECCLCGSLMIDSVQLPFVAEQDPAEQKEIETWRI